MAPGGQEGLPSQRRQRRNSIPSTVATRGRTGVTRAAPLAMSSWTRENRTAITVIRGMRSPWWRQQCAFQCAAMQRRRSRAQRTSASAAGRLGQRSSARSTTWGSGDLSSTPKGCPTSFKLDGRGGMQVTDKTACRTGRRGDRHVDIPIGPCKHAAVQNPPGAASPNEGEATMGNCPPHMVPGGARPAVARRTDVREFREACPKGPGGPPSSGP